jgi:hypothetical protein
MLSVLQVVTVLMVAVTMSMALAHALELPGKRRLDREAYFAVQPIYYPGFTIGGFLEPLSLIPTVVLLFMTRNNQPAFWLTLVAFVALAVMHTIFWVFTQPVNKFWLKQQSLNALGKRFFSADAARQGGERTWPGGDDWIRMRDRWEYSHLARALISFIALATLTVALAISS